MVKEEMDGQAILNSIKAPRVHDHMYMKVSFPEFVRIHCKRLHSVDMGLHFIGVQLCLPTLLKHS